MFEYHSYMPPCLVAMAFIYLSKFWYNHLLFLVVYPLLVTHTHTYKSLEWNGWPEKSSDLFVGVCTWWLLESFDLIQRQPWPSIPTMDGIPSMWQWLQWLCRPPEGVPQHREPSLMAASELLMSLKFYLISIGTSYCVCVCDCESVF
jgi:hypothetical protein